MAFNIPPLPNARLFDEAGQPTTTMQIYWQGLTQALSGAINTLANVTGTVLPGFEDSIKGAQAAADNANKAADTAKQAAMQASSAADQAQQQSAANAREQALINSYITPSTVLTASPTTITIAAHVRHYADGTSANVNGGSTDATASGDTDFVSYSDPMRQGGNVTFIVSKTAPVQTGDTHVIGAITIPTSGTANGGRGPQQPGYVEP